MKYRGLILGIVAVFVLAVAALVVIDLAEESRRQIPVLGSVPDFTFTERSGTPFGKEQMTGKINIINFFFTSCKGPCPYMNTRMSELYRRYATTDLVQFVSISVDPETDSLSVLRDYAAEYGVTDYRWLFLRGAPDEVQTLAEEGFMLAGELPNLHSTKFILVDENAQIRGYYSTYDQASLDLLTVHVRELVRRIRWL